MERRGQLEGLPCALNYSDVCAGRFLVTALSCSTVLSALQRIMGVLSVEAPNAAAGPSKRSKGAVSAMTIPVTVAGVQEADDAADAVDADAPAEPPAKLPRDVELDPEAAAMWRQFLAGSRATNVPMWDNRMVADLPKVFEHDGARAGGTWSVCTRVWGGGGGG